MKILLMFVILLGICGFTPTGRESEQNKKKVEDYLQGKYGEVFHVLSFEKAGILEDCDTYRVVVDGKDKETDWFTVKCFPDRGADCYEDTYAAMADRDEMEAAVMEQEAFRDCECKVYINKMFFPGYARDADYFIFVKAENMDIDDFYRRCEQLFAEMQKINQPGLVRIYGMSGEAFMEISRINCEVYLKDYYQADGEKCYALSRRVVKNE